MTMESMESYVPPGFRFHPTDEELVGYYLRKKVASQKIDLDVIRDIDLYRIEPWDLKERCRIGYEEQNQWYFFSHKDKKYPTGTRTNRATVAGFWKATGRDKAVSDKSKLIGMRKTLVFYKGRAPNGQKTDWIMHEYRLESDEHGLPQEEGWVVCRAFKKRSTGHTTNRRSVSEGWDSSYLYDEPGAGVSSVVDPVEYMARQGLMCKQEIAQEAADNLNLTTFMQAATDQYLQQLPQLASPSLPLLKRPSSVSLLSDNHSAAEEERNRNRVELSNDNNSNYNTNKRVMTTDWRAFDKFVASQLSQEDRCEADSSFGVHSESSDMALLLLEEW